jgi:LysM repeat protein
VLLSPELAAAQGHGHIVQPGDTLMRIGYTYGVNWVDLAAINTLPNPDRLSIGQRLTIPISHTGHRISGHLPAELDVELYPYVRKEIVVQLEKQTAVAYENGRPIVGHGIYRLRIPRL